MALIFFFMRNTEFGLGLGARVAWAYVCRFLPRANHQNRKIEYFSENRWRNASACVSVSLALSSPSWSSVGAWLLTWWSVSGKLTDWLRVPSSSMWRRKLHWQSTCSSINFARISLRSAVNVDAAERVLLAHRTHLQLNCVSVAWEHLPWIIAWNTFSKVETVPT